MNSHEVWWSIWKKDQQKQNMVWIFFSKNDYAHYLTHWLINDTQSLIHFINNLGIYKSQNLMTISLSQNCLFVFENSAKIEKKKEPKNQFYFNFQKLTCKFENYYFWKFYLLWLLKFFVRQHQSTRNSRRNRKKPIRPKNITTKVFPLQRLEKSFPNNLNKNNKNIVKKKITYLLREVQWVRNF